MVLSGCRWFSVLSRAATHSIAGGSPFIPRDFARLTGANYLIYGAIVERRNGLSLGIELADAETGHIRWANRYDATQRRPARVGRRGVPADRRRPRSGRRRHRAQDIRQAGAGGDRLGGRLPASRARLPALLCGANGPRRWPRSRARSARMQPTRMRTPCWRSRSISRRRCKGIIAGRGARGCGTERQARARDRSVGAQGLQHHGAGAGLAGTPRGGGRLPRAGRLDQSELRAVVDGTQLSRRHDRRVRRGQDLHADGDASAGRRCEPGPLPAVQGARRSAPGQPRGGAADGALGHAPATAVLARAAGAGGVPVRQPAMSRRHRKWWPSSSATIRG